MGYKRKTARPLQAWKTHRQNPKQTLKNKNKTNKLKFKL